MKVFKNDIVEVQNSKFEFWRSNKPTGHHMRGLVTEVNDSYCVVESFVNGKLYKINEKILIKVK